MSEKGVKKTQEYRKPRKRIKLEERAGVLGKECTKCEEWKSLELFDKRPNGVGGVRGNCKECRRDYLRNYIKRDYVDKKRKEYYSENSEYFKEVARENYNLNSVQRKEQKKQYREENRDKIIISGRDFYRNNRDTLLEKKKVYRLENREVINKKLRDFYDANKDYFKEYQSNYRKLNKDKMRLLSLRRRARKKYLIDDLTDTQLTEIKEIFNGCCLTGNEEVHMDHVIPLATGHVGTTYGNMIPLRGDLNISKNDSNIFEWFEANRQRFELSQERFDNLIAYLASANAMTVEEYRDHVYWCHANPRNINELEAN
jgi:hypothetical protein